MPRRSLPLVHWSQEAYTYELSGGNSAVGKQVHLPLLKT